NDLHPNGGDVLYGNQGNDVVIGDNVYITRDDSTAVVQKIETIDPDKGGDDFIDGSQGMDTLLGGFGDDTLMGGTQDDVLLGDNGLMEWLSNGRFGDITGLSDVIQDENAALFAKYSAAVADTDVTTLDLVTTANPTLGGRDLIIGGDGKDFAFSGTDVDTIFGDDGLAANLPEGSGGIDNKDLLFGDHGRIYPQFSEPGVDVNSRNFFSIHMGNADGGDGDRMWGEEGADLLLGGQGDDRMFGGSGHDDMIGGHNVSGGFDELTTPAIVATINPPVNDVMDGGTGDDAMSGDNATIWRRADDISPRFRTTGTTIYSTTDDTISTNFGVDNQSDPLDAVGRDIRLLDHADATPTGLSGDDVMAGNAGHDTMFGELGNDLMQGDGFIGVDDGVAATISRQIDFADSGSNPDTDQTLFFNIPEAVTTDGNDYMEGNGGNDFMYGNLGQDDMIGGSSNLFGLVSDVMRPDGSDIMFGGAAMDISRNNIGDATENISTGVITTTATGHAQDSDYMMGDNATIFRLVQGGSADAFLTFAYDNYDGPTGLKIIPRANLQLDYTLGGADYAGGTYTNGVANNDNGASDLMHGESGDDFIFGMTASDVIFGEGQDDDAVGGYGNDWISGGTGQDGVIGDDGLIFTSRNGTAETLYNIAATTQSIISTSGQIQYAIINVTDQLKKSVELVPFSYDADWDATEDEFFGNFTNTPFADDAIFGGLGSDFLHGGSGDDAMSGAEALAHAYVPTYAPNGTPNGLLDLGYDVVGVPATINPGDVLAFDPNDPDAPALSFAGEFDLFDEDDARRKVLLDSSGNLWKSAAQGAASEFLLNFNEDEGVVRPAGQVTGGGRPLQYLAVHDDGRDVIFGDNGNDWLVGGTGRDDLWGGWGNDLMNADDDHTTNGNLNNAPDTHPTYEDRAYGGAGRDVLLSNTGGDRLIDWVGEFNSYFVPFSPFGDPDVSRFLLPFLPEYLYALSKADGADQSQIRDFAGGVTLRNGEPGGEIGLVLQSDVAWGDQIGAPADPQPGTIPGGGRDVLWSADPTIPQGGSGQGLLTADPSSTPSGNVTAITEDQMSAVANAAVQQWSSVLRADQREPLNTLQFALVAELPNDAVAWNVGDGLTLVDRYAAGRGWFVDSTPSSSGEFRGMDLLTALIHEIGHTLGYDHDDGGPMNATLASGQRELLIDWQANVKDLSATLGWNNHRQYQRPAFPEFTVDLSAPAPKKRLLADIETEPDVTTPAEIDWYVDV
ncbi:MAG TPA: hypothetical protein VFR18_03230, partial [Terriglobia bacterium]|nr:hypothetical protein [Terriglobia bacterium]